MKSLNLEYGGVTHHSFGALYHALDGKKSPCMVKADPFIGVSEVLKRTPAQLLENEARRLLELHQIDPVREAEDWQAAAKTERKSAFDEADWKFRAWGRSAAHKHVLEGRYGEAVVSMLNSFIVLGPAPAPFNPTAPNAIIDSLRRIDADNGVELTAA